MSLNFDNLIEVNEKEVLRYLEYKGQYISDNLKNNIDECIKITKEKINPRYILGVYPILRENDSTCYNKIAIKGSDLRLKSKDLYNILKDCEECIIISATLGIEIEKEIRKYSYCELSKSIIMDACATTAIEEVCDAVQSNIEKELNKKGKYITMRYSPGYGDLPLELNKEILNLLSAQNKIGLTINDSGIMIPRKSVVAIMGITHKTINRVQPSCLNCENHKTCKYKKGDVSYECNRIYKK
jgi:hypothetical protein